MRTIWLGAISLSVFFIFFSLLILVAETKEINPNDVEKIFFHIGESLGVVDGYIIFYDKDNNMCATNGRFSLYKEITTYTIEKSFIHPTKRVAKTKERFIEDETFNAKDFQTMELRNRDVIYALPFSLSGNKAGKGDIIILKWYNFEIKKKIY